MRFLKDTDYAFQIKAEILKLIDGSTPNLSDNYKLLKAENAAIKQARNWLGSRIDRDVVFAAAGEPDTRDEFIVMLIIDLTLYHLYAQTPNKDVPAHRSSRYEDALSWLKSAGSGEIETDLPTAISETNDGQTRMWSKGYDDDDY
jgi:phage gp36-like protein